jgi:hypothetical protein
MSALGHEWRGEVGFAYRIVRTRYGKCAVCLEIGDRKRTLQTPEALIVDMKAIGRGVCASAPKHYFW